MFTGIVQEIGSVLDKKQTDAGISLEIQVESSFLDALEIGASISVNGVCLTAVQFTDNSVTFDVIPETLRVTNLDEVNKGSKVNLERSLKFGDEVVDIFCQAMFPVKLLLRLLNQKKKRN